MFVLRFFLFLIVSSRFPCKSLYSVSMADFSKICHSDGTFKANDIILDHSNTIKVFVESGTLMRLQFSVPENETCISEFWQRKMA